MHLQLDVCVCCPLFPSPQSPNVPLLLVVAVVVFSYLLQTDFNANIVDKYYSMILILMILPHTRPSIQIQTEDTLFNVTAVFFLSPNRFQ